MPTKCSCRLQHVVEDRVNRVSRPSLAPSVYLSLMQRPQSAADDPRLSRSPQRHSHESFFRDSAGVTCQKTAEGGCAHQLTLDGSRYLIAATRLRDRCGRMGSVSWRRYRCPKWRLRASEDHGSIAPSLAEQVCVVRAYRPLVVLAVITPLARVFARFE